MTEVIQPPATNGYPGHRFEAGQAPKSEYIGNYQSTAQDGSTIPPSITQKADYGQANGTSAVSNNPRAMKSVCGPLLNYKRMSRSSTGIPAWHGSVLIVAEPGASVVPELSLKCSGAIGTQTSKGESASRSRSIRGAKLYEDPTKAFWRFDLEVPFQEYEAIWQYTPEGVDVTTPDDPKGIPSWSFVVPAADQSMRIMFHSCNGFSVGTDEAAWSGPALWNDVVRVHDQKPFHVMIGGGDQIYNDGIRVNGPLNQWTAIGNPHKRRAYPFGEQLRDDCDKYYFQNYVKWFSTDPFAKANSRIPQVNIWDDHDIIDGFGSYTDHFMRCAVFRGIGGVSLKYYCLFQHHIPPPVSTFTTDAPQTMHTEGRNGTKADPEQTKNAFILKESADPSFIVGKHPGPYVEEPSRSLYMQLGARIAFLGIDARTERTRHQVNYPETYDLIFQRVASELSQNASLTHLIVLLGVPIAYPRLAWLENIFTSPIMGPIRFLNKRFGVAGGLFNNFDGNVDLLDDLDDHYTARQHKAERKDLMLRLQALAKKHNIRVSILGGDVHLAAMGRFYSNPKLKIPWEQDHRYMANIISSAITNKPPPKAVANLLARRNFIHHLDHETDETLMNLFDRDPGASQITRVANHCTMPSRNYAIITECAPTTASSIPTETTTNGATATAADNGDFPRGKDGHSPLQPGEEGAGTKHAVASGVQQGTLVGGLDVAIRVEMDQHDPQGKTEGYGFSIPRLTVS